MARVKLPVSNTFALLRIFTGTKDSINRVNHMRYTSQVYDFSKGILSSGDIKAFLDKNEMKYDQGYTCTITTCPRQVRKRLKLSQTDKLFINNKTGYFVCHSCKKCGTWDQLQDNIGLFVSHIKDKKRKPRECFEGTFLSDIKSSNLKKAEEIWNSSHDVNDIEQSSLEDLLGYLNIQNIKLKTLKKFQVRVTQDLKSMILPNFGFDKSLKGVKLMSYEFASEEDLHPKIFIKAIPRFQNQGLFGWNTISESAEKVVVTSSELDALAAAEQHDISVLGLPRGETVLPQQLFPVLEQFKKIILWLGGDQNTWEKSKLFAKKLGESRCHLIRPDTEQPNALKAIQKEIPLQGILRTARPVQHKSIVTFSQLRDDVFTEITKSDEVAGVKWQRYPHLNRLLKGHRRGELTVFTGPTGSGKTTFMSDYSLDLCTQGVNTLWGSFEINNVRLLRTMLTQHAQVNLTNRPDKFEEFADSFESLPMYFMTFHGQENIARVIETMSHAVYVHDIAHVIVDNLQFMMGVGNDTTDRFLRQDNFIGHFRRFATHMNCHVSLVIHPRKEREADDLTISSIFGGAKATQEADNVLILQDRRLTSLRGRKYLQIAKNRFSGDLGVMLLKFNKDTLSFATKQQFSDGDKKTGHLKQDSKESISHDDTHQRQLQFSKDSESESNIHMSTSVNDISEE